jgi:hypothetical protein
MNELKVEFKRIGNLSNSVKFWNVLVLVGLIITGVLSLDILSVVLGIMSVVAGALFLEAMGSGSDDYLDNHLWLYLTPFAWGLLIIGLIMFCGYKLYVGTIVKFNKWLDK